MFSSSSGSYKSNDASHETLHDNGPSSSLPGLYHLHGATGGSVWVQGSRRGACVSGRVGRATRTVWTPVPFPVPGGHVQQWQQGRQVGARRRPLLLTALLRTSSRVVSPLHSLQCPTCKTIYGVKTGNQPAGKMEYHVIPHSLPGHPDCKSIRVIYNIPPGLQVRTASV